MRKRVDFTQGSVFKTLLSYSFPMMVTNLVQVLFHAADVAILGIMASDLAVAAVGACGYLITLLVSLFSGLAGGANVLISKRVGAKSKEGAQKAVGVSLTVGFLSGVILMVIALLGARTFLVWINCDPEVLDQATLYLRIYFAGMPVLMLYNFVAGILRSVGDSVRPMNYMIVAGILNILLNVVFVAFMDLAVAGVALATVFSQAVALVLALRTLFRNQDYCKVKKENLRIRREELFEILRVGVPASLCGIFFYVGNLILSSRVNLMGTDAMAANAISGQLDTLIYQVGASIAISCMVAVGQNVGARKAERVQKFVRTSVLFATALSLTLGVLFYYASDFLCGIMSDSPAVISLAKDRMTVLCFTYFTTSIMEIFAFSIRSLNRAYVTMIVGGITGLLGRSVWAHLVFPLHPTLGWLFTAYFATSCVAICIYYPVYRVAYRKIFFGKPNEAEAA